MERIYIMAKQTATLKVENMSCGHCSGMVQKTLEDIEGVSNISVDLEGKKATFDVDSVDLIDTAEQKITEAGYPASK